MSFAEAPSAPSIFRICFVCTGNICRSPMAEAIFRTLISRGGYSDRVSVGSAATGDWHVGEPADPRTISALAAHGYDATRHRARQFDPEWFADLDLVVAFDRGQERTLREWAMSEQDRYIDPDAWGRLITPREGSWWPEWTRWLVERSGSKVATPDMGAPERGLAVLSDAPGTYVLQR